MEYSVNKLSKISGASARTLRYYDEIGLLRPLRVAASGYRIYGQEQVDLLQQILFYKELGFALEDIKKLLQDPDFSAELAFKQHLDALHNKRERLNRLILNVEKSMAAMKGEILMSNSEKFEGFKRELIDENERKYGAEIREKYGDAVVEASNDKLMGMTKEQFDEGESLRIACEGGLKAALKTGDPAGEAAQKAADLHRRWLSFYAPNYSKEYHKNLGEMYVADGRFRAYYDKIAPGCAEFLRDAIDAYVG